MNELRLNTLMKLRISSATSETQAAIITVLTEASKQTLVCILEEEDATQEWHSRLLQLLWLTGVKLLQELCFLSQKTGFPLTRQLPQHE